MSYDPISFEGFGSGLNLRDKADAVDETECIDALNVFFTERGAVKQRAGYDNFTASTLTARAQSLHAHYRAAGSAQLLAGCGTRLEALDNTGTIVASDTGLTDGIWDFARFGTPNSEVSYAGQGEATLRSWNGAAWANVANTPKAGALAVMAVSNRLVAGRFNTTTGGPTGGAGTSSPSHVYFSAAGDVTTWATDDFIQVTPGDGEKVQAVVAWREFVFIFKESKFFVVYGESTDSGGDPVFTYRAVDTGVGLVSPRAVCAAEDGVYFLDRRGVYRTTGSEAQLLSSNIDPIFLGGASDYYLGGELNHTYLTNAAMAEHEKRIYLSFTTGGANDRTLVYDPLYEWWSLYDIPASSLVSFRPSTSPELFFGYAAGDTHVGRHANSYTSDDGTAITARWRSGWFDYGQSEVKTIRESKAWGTGECYLGVSHDFIQDPGSLSYMDFRDDSVATWGGSTWGGTTWGYPATLISALRRYAVRGTAFSTYFSNTALDTTFSVHRLTHHLREQRVPSVTEAN